MSKLSEAFYEDFKNVNADVAQEEIVKCHNRIKELKVAMSEDVKLRDLKEAVKDLRGGYTSVINLEKAKIDFFVDKINEIDNNEVNPTSSLKKQ